VSRKLENWIDGYLEYTANTESATIFHKWTAMSVIAAALRKKVYFNLGRIRVYPNLYVVLVAEPGAVRKTQAITYGRRIMSKVDSIITSADAVTMQALIQDIESAAQVEHMPDGSAMTHNSLTVISREFESFLGQKKENTGMLVLLTDLFDCEELPWKYRTKNSGSNSLSAVFLNLLAATTPGSLASSLPVSAIGGGLTTRIVFVFSSAKSKKVPFPESPPEVLELALIQDLEIISRICGTYDFSPFARARWEEWYMDYDEMSPNRICQDRLFDGWYARKPMIMIKIAQILSAAISNSLTVEWTRFEEAESMLLDVESAMGKTFCAVGKSDISSDVAEISAIVSKYGSIEEKHLLQLVWRDIDSEKFRNVIDTAIKTGSVVRVPNGSRTFYAKGSYTL
jgi:hypothetical protein